MNNDINTYNSGWRLFSYKNNRLVKLFQELWKVTKAHIKECRNCEFRPVCPDNRIPKKTGESEYEHITTCQYNPHTNAWKNEGV